MKTRHLCLLAIVLVNAPVVANDKPDLGWLAGAWCGSDQTTVIEEHWLPERGGLMLGVNRSVSAKGVDFEFLRIELTDAGARYIAQPGGRPPTSFELLSAEPNAVTFANLAHDFPKRIRYARSGDTLHARVDDGRDGANAQEFSWTRCKDARESG